MGNSDYVVISVSIDFLSNSQWDAPFHCIAYDYFCAGWDSLCNHLRHVPWEDIFKLSVSAVTSEFCEWVQFEIDVCIHMYAAIVHRNHFSESKVKFRQTSNCCKSVLEAAKLAMLKKRKSPLLSRNMALGTLPSIQQSKGVVFCI